MTADEFFALPDDDRIDRRLIRGRLVERPYPYRCPAHAAIVANLSTVIGGWTKHATGGRWKAYGYGCPYRLRHNPDTVLCFDTSVVPVAVADATPKRASYVDGIPTIAVEVIDQSDPFDAVRELVGVAVTSGIPMFWLVDPTEAAVAVYRPSQSTVMYKDDDELHGDPELPGFRCRVAEIFE